VPSPSTSTPTTLTLAEFNGLPRPECLALLHSLLDVDSWADGLCDTRPHVNLQALRAESQSAGSRMTAEEILGALSRHPRIGSRLNDGSVEDTWSRQEQAGVRQAGAPELAVAHATYEAKFGFIFLIRAAGRSLPDILAAMHGRLGNDPATEVEVVRSELLDIAGRRLDAMVTA
jgi:2-oxo-4-hydroxy-4-carboxy-5-ureidoimidazoline decarboxylase